MEQEKQTAKESAVDESVPKYAGFWIRFLAALLDGIVINAAISLVMAIFKQPSGLFNFSSTNNSNLLWDNTWQSYTVIAVRWIYNIVMLKYYNGATLGKMALRLRVIKADGELDWVTIILRETIGKFASEITLLIGYMMAGWDSRKQALHDKIAGTYVIRE